MAWMLLLAAIASEVTGTLALRASQGFTRMLPSLVVVVGYALAFVLLAQSLRQLKVGPTYAIWSGLGTVGAGVGGMLLFAERLTGWTVAGMALIILGVVLIGLGGGVSHG